MENNGYVNAKQLAHASSLLKKPNYVKRKAPGSSTPSARSKRCNFILAIYRILCYRSRANYNLSAFLLSHLYTPTWKGPIAEQDGTAKYYLDEGEL